MNSIYKKGCMELNISESKICNKKYNILHHWKNNNIAWSALRSGCNRITRERWQNKYHKIFEERLKTTKQDLTEIKHLTYHHQAGGNGGDGSASAIYSGIHATHTSGKCNDQGQCDKEWGDVAYHYMVDRFGNIIEARSLSYAPNSGTQGEGSAGNPGNFHYPGHFAVMFAGNFHKSEQKPHDAAIVSAARILSAAQLKFKLAASSIKPHNHHSPIGTGKPNWGTTCPGNNFSTQDHNKLVRLTTAMSIQTILKSRHCQPGDVDGKIGRKTIMALQRLEAVSGDLPSYLKQDDLLEALFKESRNCQ